MKPRQAPKRPSGSAQRKALPPDRRKIEKSKERKRYAWARAFRFETIDGEATSDGRYVLLGCSDGKHLYDRKGLSTKACLEFLTTRSVGTLWGFAFDYDTNQILGGLDVTTLEILAYRNRCYFGEYRIVHLPGKMLRVTNRDTGQTTTVWDAYSFIRTSFARWLRDWKIAQPAELAFIEEMKEARPDFADDDLKRIRQYNRLELVLLHRGVEELLGRIRASGYKPASFHSPGSVSAAVMKHFHVRDHKGLMPERVLEAARLAYYGGRFETRMIGRIAGPLYHYDINSAYPAAASRLPCFACGRWTTPREVDLAEPDQLVFITWKPRGPSRRPQDRPPFGAFPVRLAAGSLRYPLASSEGGWYWSQEANAGRALARVKVQAAIRFVRGCDHEPFAFIPDLYHLRRKLQDEGDPAEYVFKLILNSCYGKLAQRPRSETDQPAYSQPAWAGIITATTRAKLLEAIALDPNAAIQTATDGLTTLRRLPLPISDSLGDWSEKEIDLLLIVQSGIYFWRDRRGDKLQRSRGFHPATLTFARAAAHLRLHPGKALILANRRFIGYRTALHRGKLDTWRTWDSYEARLGTSPEPRRETLRRVNGHIVSVPQLRATVGLVDQAVPEISFDTLQAWELEQPD